MNLALALLLGALSAPEVRQLVYFDFLPGKTEEAIRLFRAEALPLYVENDPMLRFRAYREAESPEPVDLVVVSSFRGMAGMDRSNRALGEEAAKRGSTVGEIYGRIGALSERHRDEFVEIDPALSWGEVSGASLVAFVSLRLAPGKKEVYARILRDEVVPWEKRAGIAAGGEGGAYLVSDGLAFFRLLCLSSLDDWHRYVTEARKQPFALELDGSVAAERVMLLAPVPELSVR
jgi:hypothetical protein